MAENDRRLSLVVALALVLAVAALVGYAPARGHEFVNFDDDEVILRNPGLRLGLGAAGVQWAFTTTYAANWFPLTWLSLLVDYERAGLDPSAFLTTNILIHCLSAGLLMLVLAAATRAPWRSAFVAGVFALHPLHVESVAWATERKDVLSAFFWIATMGAYVRYARAPSFGRYAAVVVLLALGLMSKPVLVTLPFALLLFDRWPLGRFGAESSEFPARSLPALVTEKLPLLALALASSAITLVAQRSAGAVADLFPLHVRIANAVLAYGIYLRQSFWPSGLAVYYPHPGEAISWAAVGLALGVLVLVSGLVVKLRDRMPHLAVGWFWFLGVLVPVIGLVQVGEQAHADRYMYLPMIGVSMAVAWSLPSLLDRWGLSGRIALGAGVAALLALGLGTRQHLHHWRDSVALFERALAVTSDNAVARMSLGMALIDKGDLSGAATHLNEAIRLQPGAAEAHGALGEVRARQGRLADATSSFEAALRLDPGLSRVRNGFGKTLVERGELDAAMVQFQQAIEADPWYAEPYNNLGTALLRQASFTEAISYFERAVSLEPGYAEALNNWGVALMQRGQVRAAIERLERAVALRPGYGQAHANWALLLAGEGDGAGAVEHFRAALAGGEGGPEIHQQLGLALARLGDYSGAAEQFGSAVRYRPDDPDALTSWGLALANLGDLEGALARYDAAIEADPEFGQAHNRRGVVLAQLGRLDEAERAFRSAARLTPDSAELFNNWGLALGARGELSPAIERFREAVRIDPRHADAQNNLGVFLAQVGRLRDAERHLAQALRLDPENERTAANLERVRAALQSPR